MKKTVVNVFVNLSRIVLEKIEIILYINVFKNNLDSFFLTKNLVL